MQGGGYAASLSAVDTAHIDLAMSRSGFSAWMDSAPTAVLERALEMVKEKNEDLFLKQFALQAALERRERGDKERKEQEDKDKERKEREDKGAASQKVWKTNDTASMVWDFEGTRSWWPGTIHGRVSILRVKVVNETQMVEMQDCTTGEDYIGPSRQKIVQTP